MMKPALLFSTFAALAVVTVAQARDRGVKSDGRSQKQRCRSEKVCRTEEHCAAFSNLTQANGNLAITCSDTSVRHICASQPVCD